MNTLGDLPRAYEPQVRIGYSVNPVAESVGSVTVAASDLVTLALVAAKSGEQSLFEMIECPWFSTSGAGFD